MLLLFGLSMVKPCPSEFVHFYNPHPALYDPPTRYSVHSGRQGVLRFTKLAASKPIFCGIVTGLPLDDCLGNSKLFCYHCQIESWQLHLESPQSVGPNESHRDWWNALKGEKKSAYFRLSVISTDLLSDPRRVLVNFSLEVVKSMRSEEQNQCRENFRCTANSVSSVFSYQSP
jgi:hypothetical protein